MTRQETTAKGRMVTLVPNKSAYTFETWRVTVSSAKGRLRDFYYRDLATAEAHYDRVLTQDGGP